jgi:hypothetical protein
MMQCSSAATQIQYSRYRIFFGFEDEIAGAEVWPRWMPDRRAALSEVTAGYYRELCANNQSITEQKGCWRNPRRWLCSANAPYFLQCTEQGGSPK